MVYYSVIVENAKTVFVVYYAIQLRPMGRRFPTLWLCCEVSHRQNRTAEPVVRNHECRDNLMMIANGARLLVLLQLMFVLSSRLMYRLAAIAPLPPLSVQASLDLYVLYFDELLSPQTLHIV